MASWQKRARLVVAAIGLAVVVLVALTMRHRQAPAPAAPVARMDPKAVSESSGVRLIQSTGEKLPGILDAEHTLVYTDGSSKLIKPKFTKDRSGVPYVVTSQEAKVGPDQSSMVMNGDVHLVSGDGLDVKTGGEASYARNEGILRAPGPVSFAKGTMTGTSMGMTYDEKQDLLWLLDQAVVTVAPGEKTGHGAEVVAGAAAYARKDNYMRFERTVKITREGRVVSADSATAFLAEGGNHLQSLELRGHSDIVATGAVAGGLQAMRARDMNLTYGPDGETLERAVLSGDAAIQLAGDAGKPGRRIAGEYIDVAFASAGEVTSLSARDRVELKIPSDADAPERVIRSTSMDGTGEAGKGLTGARFEGSVEFREARGPGQVRRARATVLDVSMAPGSGEIEDARFTGGTRFEDGALRASAKDGRYQIAKGVLELTGVENGVDPRVQDDHVAVDATRIDLTFEGTKLVATGQVRSLLKPAREARDRKSPKGPAATPKPATATAAAGKTAAGTHLTAKDAAGADGKPAQRVPGMLKDDKPVNVTSDTLDYDGGRSLATYTGKARLWQEETTITGETITIDDKSGDLKATGGAGLVRSAFTLEQTNAKTQAKEQVPSIATGKDLHYEDALRRATYTTEAHVNGPQGDCHAVKIEMYFADAGNTLERAEAYQQVKLLADQRTATGDRMTYFAADEKYLMTGKPVKTVDEECRETTGKTLTFWRSTDRIIVDGNEEIRTLTTNSAAPASGATATCTPARPR